MIDGPSMRRALILVALFGLAGGLAALLMGRADIARWIWAAATLPVAISLAVSMVRDLLAGKLGVDAIALLSMIGALALGETLAGAVVAVMYAGGAALEDFAVGRAERDLKSLIDRAPRIAHRRVGGSFEDAPVDQVSIGDSILVRAGEVVPVDGLLISASASIDDSALTGEPIPVLRRTGEAVSSGALNAGETFEMQASATAGDSAYAGIVKLVSAAQTAKAPFIRLADRFALALLPLTLALAGGAWALSHDPIRALAVLVAATPCPLILAAPAAFVAGTSQAARRGVLIKGGGPLEALARAHTVMFDKTGTLTVGGARLVALETAPGEDADEALRLAASLEQASQHVVASAVVAAALDKDLALQIPSKVRETMGSGLEGIVEGRQIRVGSHQLVYGSAQPADWAARALRRASWRSALSVFVSVDGRPIAALLLADELRREAPRAIQALRSSGVERIVMVTGDRADAAETIAAALDLDAVLANRVPADKVDAVATEQRSHPTVMVGDGINDAPALAAADVGVAMGARGASASSEAADVVVLVDQLDRVSDAIAIARRTRAIALQSIVAGMGLAAAAMGAAALGWLTPVAGALTQEAIDVAVILNALRALRPAHRSAGPQMPADAARMLRKDHDRLKDRLDRLRQIADALDDATPEAAVANILEADRIVSEEIVAHERDDENAVYPRLASFLADGHGLCAMSRAHREILHQARLLARLSDGLGPAESDRYLIRDAQRIIESIEALVRLHNAQEEDIYERAAEDWGAEDQKPEAGKAAAARKDNKGFKSLEPTTSKPKERSGDWSEQTVAIALAILAFGGGWAYWSMHREGAVHYATHKVELGSVIRTAAAAGTVSAANVIPVLASASGAVQSVSCEVNTKVEAGQICAKIDPAVDQLAVDRAKADLLGAEARLQEDQKALSEAKARFERARISTQRRRGSRTAFERVRQAYERAQDLTKNNERAVDEFRAALQAAEAALKNTNVIAPATGTVVASNAQIGKTVVADNQTPLFLIATDLSALEVEAAVDAKDIADVKLGDKAEFTVESAPGHFFAGAVTQIAQRPGTIQNAEAYDAAISAPNPGGLLEPGMEAAVKIVTASRDDVLRAPLEALRFTPSGIAPALAALPEGWSRLWVLRDGKPTPVAVELGLEGGNFVEILKGDLKLGDELIVKESEPPAHDGPTQK